MSYEGLLSGIDEKHRILDYKSSGRHHSKHYSSSCAVSKPPRKNVTTFPAMMKYFYTVLTLAASSMAMPPNEDGARSPKGSPTVCESHQTVVCSGNGDGDLLSLGNLLTGFLGESCSGGDVYCCSQADVDQVWNLLGKLLWRNMAANQMGQIGLINLDLNLQCSLNHLF